MQGGLVSLTILKHHIAPAIAGADPLDHAVIHDRLLHRLVKLGPEGALTSALAALDIALWDLKGQLLGQPIWRLLGGAWRTALPFYSSIGGNGAPRSVDEVLRIVEARLRDKPAAIKIRFDNDRVDLDSEIPDHLAKARAVRKLVGDDFPLAFDANNGYTPGGAMRVGRVLEELGYWWFEEPVQHYHVRAMGEVARKLSITVSAGEQSYTPAAVADLILAGVPHTLVDFGDDRYTQGRLHPMLDPTLRNHAILQAAEQPEVQVLLLDVILGYGVHPDPAGVVAPVIRQALSQRPDLKVLVPLLGTDLDPQPLAAQADALRQAGAHLYPSSAAAAHAARTYAARPLSGTSASP
jgi:hypothetical protein